MKSLFFVITLSLCQIAWANNGSVNTEDFKPIALEETTAANAIIEQAVAEAQTAATTNESPTEASAATAANTETAASAEASKLSLQDTKNLKESEIPVLTKSAGQKTESKSPWGRLMISLLIIAVVAAGLFQATKWWQKKAAVNTDSNKIRVVNQHFLGPRKSLAIIRVAGETILIGVTDSNISHIKTLSLLDDEEVSNEVPKNFAVELEKKDKDEESSWSQIRDRVSTKIKEMRPL